MMGHPAYANRRHAIEAAPGQPYEPFSTDEFLAWRLVDFDALPRLEEPPKGWELLQLEPVPLEEQIGAWARAARAVFDHIEQHGGIAGLAQVLAAESPGVHPEFHIALYRRPV